MLRQPVSLTVRAAIVVLPVSWPSWLIRFLPTSNANTSPHAADRKQISSHTAMRRTAPNGQKKAPVSIDTAIREGTSFTRLLGVYVHLAPPSLQLNVPFLTPVLPLIYHCFFFIGIIPLNLTKSRGPLVLKLGVEHVAAAGGGDVVACYRS